MVVGVYYHAPGGGHLGENVVVRILLVLALLATLCGCGQASDPPEHSEKKGTHETARQPEKGPTGAPQHDAASRERSPEQGSVSTGDPSTVAEKRGRPNIILILTDDLDAQPGSISRMPKLQRYLSIGARPSTMPS